MRLAFVCATITLVAACASANDRVYLRDQDPHICRVTHDGVTVWSLGAYRGDVGGEPATIVHLGIVGELATAPRMTVLVSTGSAIPIAAPSVSIAGDYYYVLPPTFVPGDVIGFVAEWDDRSARFGLDPMRVQRVSDAQPWRGEQTPWLYNSQLALNVCRTRPRPLAASDRRLPGVR